MNPYIALYYVRATLTCLMGAGGGVFLLVQRQVWPGLLALAGFVLLNVDPLTNIVVPRLLAGGQLNTAGLSLAIVCIGPLASLLGWAALLAAVLSVLTSRKQMLPGALALGGFVLLGITPIVNNAPPRLFSFSMLNPTNWFMALGCFSTFTMLLGTVMILAALIIAAQKRAEQSA